MDKYYVILLMDQFDNLSEIPLEMTPVRIVPIIAQQPKQVKFYPVVRCEFIDDRLAKEFFQQLRLNAIRVVGHNLQLKKINDEKVA